ncbi:MAG: hypothetical protein RMJ31_02290 [Nitrososphaerota archaeon]|nr:hypothetical protein [Nitrososphaerota archaeon]
MEGKVELVKFFTNAKRALNMKKLKLKWLPNDSVNLSGEVNDNIVYVYEKEIDEARRTIKHELIDMLISQVIEDYIILEKLKGRVNQDVFENLKWQVYKRKENVIQTIIKLIPDDTLILEGIVTRSSELVERYLKEYVVEV